MAVSGNRLEPSDAGMYRRVGFTLLYGLLLSIGVMLLGLLIGLIRGQQAAAHVLPLDQVLPRLAGGKATAVLDLGILLLFATPLAGVLAAFVEFIRAGDRPFATITAVLLVLLAVGFAVALAS